MKKLLSVLSLVLIIASSASAQKLFSKEWRLQQLGKDSASIAATQEAENEKKMRLTKTMTTKNAFDQASIYLDKSSKYQYGALGCTAFATGLFVWYGCTSEKFELNDEGKSKLTDKSKGLIIGGSVLGLLAIILEANAIEYKIKAGKCLRLQSDGNGAGLAFVF